MAALGDATAAWACKRILWCLLQRLEVRRAFLAEHCKQREALGEGGLATYQQAIVAAKRAWGVSRCWPGLSAREATSLVLLASMRLAERVGSVAVARSAESKKVLGAMAMPEFSTPLPPQRGGRVG